MPTHTSSLFLLEDLEDVGKTSELAEGELTALQAVADWIKTYVVKLELISLIAARGPICVCHLEEELPYSQPRISEHLGTLRRAGLVSTRREGNWVYYSIDVDGLGVAREFIDELEQSIRVPHPADSC
jgi:DNA-binding transcriptional ArsR family regulator